MIEALAAILSLSLAATDEPLVENLQKCREIGDTYLRLECYDEIASDLSEGEESDVEDAVEEAEASTGSWIVETEPNPSEDSTTAAATIPATRGKGGDGRPVRLMVRCHGKQTTVSIDWGQYLGSDVLQVTTRIDSLAPSTTNWARSTDKRGSYLRPPGTKNARKQKIVAFARQLLTAETLAARVIPRGTEPLTAVFDLSGAKAALKAVRKACVW